MYLFLCLKIDLKKDNEYIENLLNDLRTKVKETSITITSSAAASSMHGLDTSSQIDQQILEDSRSTSHTDSFNLSSLDSTGSTEDDYCEISSSNNCFSTLVNSFNQSLADSREESQHSSNKEAFIRKNSKRNTPSTNFKFIIFNFLN